MLQGFEAPDTYGSYGINSKHKRGDDGPTQLSYLTQKHTKPIHAHILQVKSLKYEQTRLQYVAYKRPDYAEPDTLITHPLRKPTPSTSLHLIAF